MNAYLGLVPKKKDSVGKSKSAHINRESRKLTRTIITRSINHISNSSFSMSKFYEDLVEKRGAGRARIALIRKLYGIMRSMLLTGECYRKRCESKLCSIWYPDVTYSNRLNHITCNYILNRGDWTINKEL